MSVGHLARALQDLKPYKFVDTPWKWGDVVAVHGGASSTLATAVNGTKAPVFTFTVNPTETVPFAVGDYVNLNGIIYQVSGLAGNTISVKQPITQSLSPGTAVASLPTVDVQMNGTLNFQAVNVQQPSGAGYTPVGGSVPPHTGLRWLANYWPIVGDTVLVARTDYSNHVVIGRLFGGGSAQGSGLAVGSVMLYRQFLNTPAGFTVNLPPNFSFSTYKLLGSWKAYTTGTESTDGAALYMQNDNPTYGYNYVWTQNNNGTITGGVSLNNQYGLGIPQLPNNNGPGWCYAILEATITFQSGYAYPSVWLKSGWCNQSTGYSIELTGSVTKNFTSLSANTSGAGGGTFSAGSWLEVWATP